MATATIDWHARASALQFNGSAFIDGRYAAAASGATFDKRSPIDGRNVLPFVPQPARSEDKLALRDVA